MWHTTHHSATGCSPFVLNCVFGATQAQGMGVNTLNKQVVLVQQHSLPHQQPPPTHQPIHHNINKTPMKGCDVVRWWQVWLQCNHINNKVWCGCKGPHTVVHNNGKVALKWCETSVATRWHVCGRASDVVVVNRVQAPQHGTTTCFVGWVKHTHHIAMPHKACKHCLVVATPTPMHHLLCGG